jgi:Cu+-exporting ATPase
MLRTQAGIYSVTVALLAERAVVTYDAEKWTPASLAEEIDDMGFEATPLEEAAEDSVTLRIYGMTCASCTGTVERALAARAGVLDASVNLTLETASVHFDPAKVGVRDIVECVEECGFDATLAAADGDSTQLQSLSRVKEVAEWRAAFLFSLSFAVPVFLVSMVLPKWGAARSVLRWQPLPNLFLEDLICLALTIPVQFGIGKRFYVSSYRALRHGGATMDVLIVLGTTASFVYSSLSMLFGLLCGSGQDCAKPATFFDTSTMLITFVTFGRYLENAAKGKTSEALSKLIGLTPSTAVIYRDGAALSVEHKVPSELIQRGDYVKVVPGEKIAADGVVVRGSSNVDESMVTGEALPVAKQEGSVVIGGTVNGMGSFDFLVSRAGKDTSLAQIVRLVSEAQTSKAPIQAFADRVAGIFVPCVVGLGSFTFIAWMIISHLLAPPSLPDVFRQEGATRLMVCLKLCISVIVVACPCALGLSTPTAVMVGTGVGAQHGILIKGGGPLEASHSVERVLFDKTGTLTEGKLTVSALCWADGEPEEAVSADAAPLRNMSAPAAGGLSRRSVLEAVGAVELRSEHPLGRAVADFCSAQASKSHEEQGAHGVPATPSTSDFLNVAGSGVSCRATLPSGSTHLVKIGNLAYVQGKGAGARPPARLAAFNDAQEAQGRTVVFATLDGSLVLAFALADRLKPSARPCVDALRAMGISVGIMTGDSEATALAIARELGIEAHDVHAGMSPNGKRGVVVRLRQEAEAAALKAGRRDRGGIAMVGDGINDSPALAAATLGIALASGSEIAMEAADVVLMRPQSLLDVPASLHLARRIFRQIRFNFVWATCYNIIGIPLAMGLFLPWGYHLHPMTAGAAMACSSVSVVLSSLTLRWWRRPAALQDQSAAYADGSKPTESAVARLEGALEWLSASAGSVSDAALRRINALRGRRGESRADYQALPVEMA